MSGADRSIRVTLEGEAVSDGRVSVRLLTKTLQAIQDVALQLGKARLARDPSTRGRAPAIVERECELFLTEATPGSLHATLQLPNQEASLFPALVQFSEAVLTDVKDVVEGIADDRPEMLQKVVPDYYFRERIIKILAGCSPSADSDYRLSIGIGAQQRAVPIVRPDAARLSRLVGTAPAPTKQGKQKEAVFEGTFLATLKDDGSPLKVLSVINYEPVEEDTRPFRTAEIVHEGRCFKLRHEIACRVGKQDHLLVLEYEPLAIRTFGLTRGEVLDDFRETFAFLWDDYASASDDTLTDDAIALKRRLLDLVQEVVAQ